MCCCVREAASYETKVLLLGMVVRIPRFIHIRGNGMGRGAKQKELGEGSSQLEIGFVEIKREVGKGRVGRYTYISWQRRNIFMGLVLHATWEKRSCKKGEASCSNFL